MTALCLILKIPINTQIVLFVAVLLITGIPHGSLDYYLEKQRHANFDKKFNSTLFLFKYVLDILLYALLWYYFPNLSLLIFIFIAGYHFGEIDWVTNNASTLNTVMATAYGLFIISYIITAHIIDTAPIIELLIKKRYTLKEIITIGSSLKTYILLGLMLIICIAFIARKSLGWKLKDASAFLLQTLTLFILITFLPFYLSFLFYFGIWHSFLSFDIIRKELNFKNNSHGWRQIIFKCLPFVVVTFISLFLFSYSGYKINLSDFVLNNLIIGIAVLTLPHLQVFSKAIKSVRKLKDDDR